MLMCMNLLMILSRLLHLDDHMIFRNIIAIAMSRMVCDQMHIRAIVIWLLRFSLLRFLKKITANDTLYNNFNLYATTYMYVMEFLRDLKWIKVKANDRVSEKRPLFKHWWINSNFVS